MHKNISKWYAASHVFCCSKAFWFQFSDAYHFEFVMTVTSWKWYTACSRRNYLLYDCLLNVSFLTDKSIVFCRHLEWLKKRSQGIDAMCTDEGPCNSDISNKKVPVCVFLSVRCTSVSLCKCNIYQCSMHDITEIAVCFHSVDVCCSWTLYRML